MPVEFENLNPKIYEKSENRVLTAEEEDEYVSDEIDCREVFDLLRNVADPEYPLTLEELNVISQENITVNNETNEVSVKFTPTVPHCSMATLIGLSLRVQLLRALPTRFKVNVNITPGTHASETAVNKQLNDKERVAAALENPHLTEVINHCIDADYVLSFSELPSNLPAHLLLIQGRIPNLITPLNDMCII